MITIMIIIMNDDNDNDSNDNNDNAASGLRPGWVDPRECAGSKVWDKGWLHG